MGVLNSAELLAGGFGSALQSSGVIPAVQAATDGLVDAAAQVMMSNNANQGRLRLPAGARYRISSNITVGDIIAEGGVLAPDAGVTITYGRIYGPDNVVVFDGAGIAKSSTGTYSIGWYAGASFDLKWDFARRAFIKGARKVVIIPYPRSDDPAANYDAAFNQSTWRCMAPIKFGDPENNMEIDQYCSLYAGAANMKCVCEYSETEKTEDIYWRRGIAIDGGWNALVGELFHSGARIQHYGYSRIGRCKQQPYLLAGDMVVTAGSGSGLDQITYDYLNTTENGLSGQVIGTTDHIPYGFRIDQPFNNGNKGVFGTVATVSGSGLATVTINANGPNGRPQDFRGFLATQPLTVQSKPGNGNVGRGGVVTPSVGASGERLLTGVTVTTAGTGYVAGETVFMTAVEALHIVSGLVRKVDFGEALENQDDNSGLVPPHNAFYIVEATDAGAPNAVTIKPFRSTGGRMRALVTRKAAGVTGTPGKCRVSASGWRIPNNFNNSEQMLLQWIDEGEFRDPPAVYGGGGILVNATTDASYLKFYGIPREQVTGNGEGLTFDGARIIHSAAFGDGASTSSLLAFPNLSAAALRRVKVITNTPNVWFEGDVSATAGILTAAARSGTLVDTAAVALTGTTGTTGRFTVSYNAGRFYVENRTGSPLVLKVVLEY